MVKYESTAYFLFAQEIIDLCIFWQRKVERGICSQEKAYVEVAIRLMEIVENG